MAQHNPFIALRWLAFAVATRMLLVMSQTPSLWILLLATGGTALAATGTIADIEHVVLFMQENRAFDHYFGTMAGVRGFKDPNVQKNNGQAIWYQTVNGSLSNATDTLLPWYLNYLGGEWDAATQCMSAGSNGWDANHAALNDDLNDNWPLGNTPWSWGYYTRKELPNHFAIAEGWTVGDMYQEYVRSDQGRADFMTYSSQISHRIDQPESRVLGFRYYSRREQCLYRCVTRSEWTQWPTRLLHVRLACLLTSFIAQTTTRRLVAKMAI